MDADDQNNGGTPAGNPRALRARFFGIPPKPVPSEHKVPVGRPLLKRSACRLGVERRLGGFGENHSGQRYSRVEPPEEAGVLVPDGGVVQKRALFAHDQHDRVDRGDAEAALESKRAVAGLQVVPRALGVVERRDARKKGGALAGREGVPIVHLGRELARL